jgi:hypothetical protein
MFGTIFEVILQTPLVTGPQMVQVSVAKKSGDIDHMFECDGFPCTSRTVTLDNLAFGLQFELMPFMTLQDLCSTLSTSARSWCLV